MGRRLTAMERRHRGFLTAMAVDALGSGVWITFSLLYFGYGRGMALTTAGAALTAGSTAALLLGGLATGVLADRLGPFTAAAVSCAVRAAAFPCYLLADGPAAVAAIAFAVASGDRLYWAAHGGLVKSTAPGEERQRAFFALLNSLRNIGLGLGALAVALGAALQSPGGTALWNALPLVNAASFVVAGLLFHRIGTRLRQPPPLPPPPGDEPAHPAPETLTGTGYRD
ncbi:MFS transporter [Streptomyces katsurahamanus]|uniref:MFS transporter n=1 Tax=Streptomyces katsurahamanus TaxID=2577098 RepID=UPI00188695D9|nr:MFS transporter [Streptomyces katsurahamanus]